MNQTDAATPTTTIDDDDIRVTSWNFAEQGAATGIHRHEYDYVVVPITGGQFHVTSADGTIVEMTQVAGSVYRGTAGTEHNVEAASSAVFVELEIKSRKE
ncbi:cupin [Nakamurella antarctica]|uniref:Cupin n=1 Tax=Nakamurella antarctica TaxID=1902245 RepID=A0A3G8ZK51_9ACTN|nr:cupin [Nakamurella antarctica]AZI57225.1 cupin [Nakamurella antarctica]